MNSEKKKTILWILAGIAVVGVTIVGVLSSIDWHAALEMEKLKLYRLMHGDLSVIRSLFGQCILIFALIKAILYAKKRYAKKEIPKNETAAEKQQREYLEGYEKQKLESRGRTGEFDSRYLEWILEAVEQKKLAYNNRYKSQSDHPRFFVPKNFPDSKGSEVNRLIDRIEDAYQTVGQKCDQSMKAHVLDMEYSLVKARNDFSKALYNEILRLELGNEIRSQEDQIRRILEKNRLQEGKVGSAYVVLKTLGRGKQAKADDLKAAQILDADAAIHSQRCYYNAMQMACRELDDLNLKSLAIHYWYARILLDLTVSDYHTGQLTAFGVLSQEQTQRLLQKRLECYEDLPKYESMINNYKKTGEITELASETEEQLNKRIDAIDVPWPFKLKHRLQGIFYYKNEWLENHINSNGSYDGGWD